MLNERDVKVINNALDKTLGKAIGKMDAIAMADNYFSYQQEITKSVLRFTSLDKDKIEKMDYEELCSNFKDCQKLLLGGGSLVEYEIKKLQAIEELMIKSRNSRPEVLYDSATANFERLQSKVRLSGNYALRKISFELRDLSREFKGFGDYKDSKKMVQKCDTLANDCATKGETSSGITIGVCVIIAFVCLLLVIRIM